MHQGRSGRETPRCGDFLGVHIDRDPDVDLAFDTHFGLSIPSPNGSRVSNQTGIPTDDTTGALSRASARLPIRRGDTTIRRGTATALQRAGRSACPHVKMFLCACSITRSSILRFTNPILLDRVLHAKLDTFQVFNAKYYNQSNSYGK